MGMNRKGDAFIEIEIYYFKARGVFYQEESFHCTGCEFVCIF